MARNLAPFLVRQLCISFCEAILFSALLYQCVTLKRSVVFVWSLRVVRHLAVWWLYHACPMAPFACFPENNPGALLHAQLLDWLTESGRPFRTQRRFCGLAGKCYQSDILSAPCFSVFIGQSYTSHFSYVYIIFLIASTWKQFIVICMTLNKVHFENKWYLWWKAPCNLNGKIFHTSFYWNVCCTANKYWGRKLLFRPPAPRSLTLATLPPPTRRNKTTVGKKGFLYFSPFALSLGGGKQVRGLGPGALPPLFFWNWSQFWHFPFGPSLLCHQVIAQGSCCDIAEFVGYCAFLCERSIQAPLVSDDPRSTFSLVAGASDACFVFSSGRAGILLMMLICGLGCVVFCFCFFSLPAGRKACKCNEGWGCEWLSDTTCEML